MLVHNVSATPCLAIQKIELLVNDLNTTIQTMGQIIEYRTDENQYVQQVPDVDPVAIIQEAEGDPQPFTNHKYYIGIPCLYEDYYLGMTNIRATTYFNYDHDNVHKYLREFSCMYVPKSQHVEIMKTDFTIEYVGGYPTYQVRVVLKTCWLRMFQRIWRSRRHRSRAH